MMASTSNEKDISLPLTLPMKRKKPDIDIEKCILCQANKKVAKPIGTDNGRTKIKEACSRLKDQTVTERIGGAAADTFVYHLNCYKSYVLKGGRISLVEVPSDDSGTSLTTLMKVVSWQHPPGLKDQVYTYVSQTSLKSALFATTQAKVM